MELNNKTNLSYYKTITAINESHNIFLVKHVESGKICVKKIMDVYNAEIYRALFEEHIAGTPRIIAYGEEDNRLVVIEEYISGSTIAEKIENASLTKEKIVAYMMGLCDILSQLHSRKPAIIHRDIKPSNVIITDYDEVFLIDFNAAKNYDESENNDTVLLGTEGYAAPEQYGFGASSPRTDIYAMGILLKEMLTSINCNDAKLLSIVNRCTKLEPRERYGNIVVLKKDLSYVKEKPAAEKMPELTPNRNKFIPPGFRTMKLWKIIIASIFYTMLLSATFTFDMESDNPAFMWSDRIAILLIELLTIACWFNYGDIQQLFPLSKNKNVWLRLLGILLLNIFSIFFIVFLLYIFQTSYKTV